MVRVIDRWLRRLVAWMLRWGWSGGLHLWVPPAFRRKGVDPYLVMVWADVSGYWAFFPQPPPWKALWNMHYREPYKHRKADDDGTRTEENTSQEIRA